MSDYSELKRLAEAATKCSGPMRVETDYNGVHQVIGDGSWKILNAWHTPDGKGKENAEFFAAANPAVVLDLISDGQEATHLCDVLSVLLGQIAIAVRGPEEPKKRHGFDDLPSRVKTVVADRDQLKADLERVNDELSACKEGPGTCGYWRDTARAHLAEIEELRRDAERYRWLRKTSIPLAGHDFLSSHEILDYRIDVAMSKEASHG